LKSIEENPARRCRRAGFFCRLQTYTETRAGSLRHVCLQGTASAHSRAGVASQFDCGSRTARRFLDAQRWRPEPRLASLTKNSMAVRIGCCHQSPRSLTSHRASMLAVRHPPGWPLSGKLSRGFAYELLLMLECPRPNAGMSGAQRPTPKALPSRAVASSASSPPRDSRG
jgi:hypothetical protein